MWNHLAHTTRRSFNLNQHVGPTMFPQQLATPAARSHRRAIADRADGDEASTSGACELADHPAFGTERETIRRIFDVAARDNTTVTRQACCTDAKLGIGNIRKGRRFMSCGAQGRPVDVRHWRNASQRRRSRGLA